MKNWRNVRTFRKLDGEMIENEDVDTGLRERYVAHYLRKD